MQLIDEQNHIARPAHLLEHVLELLLKLASVLGACHHGGQVQGAHPFTQQMGRCSAVGNGQSQSLYHRGFAYTWFSDESGVVLGAAGEDLDQPLQLRLPADHRVQLTLAGHGGKVPGTLVQLAGVSSAALRLPAAHDPGDAILASQGGGQALTEPGTVYPALPQQPHGRAGTVPQKAQQQMLRVDRRLSHLFGLHGRLLNGLATAGRQPLVQGASGHPGAHQLCDTNPQAGATRSLLPQQTGGGAVLLAGQPQQQMLTAYIAVSQTGRVLLGQTDGPQRSGCKTAIGHIDPSRYSIFWRTSRKYPEAHQGLL